MPMNELGCVSDEWTENAKAEKPRHQCLLPEPIRAYEGTTPALSYLKQLLTPITPVQRRRPLKAHKSAEDMGTESSASDDRRPLLFVWRKRFRVGFAQPLDSRCIVDLLSNCRPYVQLGLLHPYTVHAFNISKRVKECVVFVATARDGELVATLTLAPYGSTYGFLCLPGEAQLRDVGVKRKYRHSGICQALLQAAIELSRQNGLERLVYDRPLGSGPFKINERVLRVPDRDYYLRSELLDSIVERVVWMLPLSSLIF
eukprot:Blabericola_migrator_1__4398@NODE_2361_length_2879_cov_14_873044_g1479_i0_p2_GENE_NODE_2361_length_2879_cov_14_873044_g1479_i0NODE_2361_length_2879_cov_14_873044_g1479_i0_p2_ORF_typecomplete_len258_score28_93Acetyltransf_1/PF00583_25/8_5e10Acetyltransf_10/PF13673_7/1_8e07Acetyltransf_7/PF13508_7/7_4e05Acetyltransf_9/PF13527_7/9_8e05Acetyltransf_4/PF13420_7/0_011Acetyltransf_6/PF13480_7/0_11Acetyltransf_CG/PF14542_6/0_065_NODE_2361_length_2879_cov_14_873044_g1479_i09651738